MADICNGDPSAWIFTVKEGSGDQREKIRPRGYAAGTLSIFRLKGRGSFFGHGRVSSQREDITGSKHRD